jgi:hypothetical protein
MISGVWGHVQRGPCPCRGLEMQIPGSGIFEVLTTGIKSSPCVSKADQCTDYFCIRYTVALLPGVWLPACL